MHKLGCVYRIRRHSWTNFSAEKLETLGIPPGGEMWVLEAAQRSARMGGVGGGRSGDPGLAGSSGLQGKVKWPIGPRLEAPGRWAPLSWLPGYLFSFVLP